MTIAETPTVPPTARTIRADRAVPPPDLVRAARDGDGALGIVASDGRLGYLAPRLLARMGFADGDDLEGLHVRHLWPHALRPRADRALAGARAGRAASAALDLSWVDPAGGDCALTLSPLDEGGWLLLRLDCA